MNLALSFLLAALSFTTQLPVAEVRTYDVRLLERIGARRGPAVETKSHLLWVWQGMEGWGIPSRSKTPFGDGAIDWLDVIDRYLPQGATPPVNALPIEDFHASNGVLFLAAPAETHLAVSELFAHLEGHLMQSVDVNVYVFEANQVESRFGVLLSASEAEALAMSTPVLEGQRHVIRTVEPAFLRETERRAALVDYYVDHSGRMVCADPLVLVPSRGLEIAIDVRPTVGSGYVARVGGRFGSALKLGTREASFTGKAEAVHDLPQIHSQVFTSTARIAGDGGGLLLGASDAEGKSVRLLITFATRVPAPAGSPFVPVGGWSSPPLAISAMPLQNDALIGRRDPFPDVPPDPSPTRRLALEELFEAELGDEDLFDGSPRLEWFESWALPRGRAENRDAAEAELIERIVAAERQVPFELRAGSIRLSELSDELRASLSSPVGANAKGNLAQLAEALDLRAFGVVQVGSRALTSSLDEVSYVQPPEETKIDNVVYFDPRTAIFQDGFAATVYASVPSDGVNDSIPLSVEVRFQRLLTLAVDGSVEAPPEFASASIRGEVQRANSDWTLIGAQEIKGLDALFITVIRVSESPR